MAMRRRDFIAAVGSAAAGPVLVNALDAASALRAAEPNRVYRLAACPQLGIAALSTAFWMRFFDRLRQLGYAEGKNLTVDRYAADGQAERYPDIARNVVQSAPDVIVVGVSHPLIAQLAKETSTIPIVAVMGDPVALGLVQNIARPERNITGIAADAGIEMQGKHLDILRQAVPSASRIAYLSPREEWAVCRPADDARQQRAKVCRLATVVGKGSWYRTNFMTGGGKAMASKQLVDPTVRQAIERMSAIYKECFNKGDAAGVAGIFTKDGVLISQSPEGPVKSGTEAIVHRYEGLFKSGFTKMDTKVGQVAQLGCSNRVGRISIHWSRTG
jgi:ABC transporter substrate binding protein